jgi:hypothetical protein
VTTIPRPRQTQDHELLVMSRVCDLLSTLAMDARARVVGYVNQRVESLPTITPMTGGGANGAAPPDDPRGPLFDDATSEATGG